MNNKPLSCVLLLITLITALSLVSCVNKPPTSVRPFSTSDLLVGVSDMPPGWRVGAQPDKATNYLGTKDSAQIEFFSYADYLKGRVVQSIYRYDSVEKAHAIFNDFMTTLPGKVPASWTYHSPVADEFLLACYDGEEETSVCLVSARYQEYTMSLYVPLLHDRMSLIDLERLLKAIDARMIKIRHRIESDA